MIEEMLYKEPETIEIIKADVVEAFDIAAYGYNRAFHPAELFYGSNSEPLVVVALPVVYDAVELVYLDVFEQIELIFTILDIGRTHAAYVIYIYKVHAYLTGSLIECLCEGISVDTREI